MADALSSTRSLESSLYYGDMPSLPVPSELERSHGEGACQPSGEVLVAHPPSFSRISPVCSQTRTVKRYQNSGRHLDVSIRVILWFQGPGAGQAHVGFGGWPHSITLPSLGVAAPVFKMPCTFLGGPKDTASTPGSKEGLGPGYRSAPATEVCARPSYKGGSGQELGDNWPLFHSLFQDGP